MRHHSGHAVLAAARRAARAADAPLLLAVSGGLDSMVLLHAMAVAARARIAAVATFDHGTGAAATDAAAQVARVAGALGLPVVVGRGRADGAPSGSREAAWRRARYAFLRSSAAALGARIVTAHTEDDQVETVLMRILRGSGARGLAALYAPSDVLRPFVGIRREALAAHALAAGVVWREDPTNRSPAFLRNRVRHELLPALRRADPQIDTHLLASARRAAAWRSEVEALIDERVAHRREGGDVLAVARAELAGRDADSLAMLWGALAGRLGLALDRRGTRRLTSFTMSDRSGGSVPLAGGWIVERTGGELVLRRASAPPPAEVPLPDGGSVRWGSFRFWSAVSGEPMLDRGDESRQAWSASLPAGSRLTVRPWAPGDRLAPAAGQGRRRVKRYLTEAGVRGIDRGAWPVVVADDDVVWIPGVRRSDAATARSGRPVLSYVCERLDR